jgi:hypothetical protein
MVQDFIKKNPDAKDIVETFLNTMEENHRYRPKTIKQKMDWLTVAKWSIKEMGDYGKEKTIDLIEYIRSGDFDKDNGYSNWVKNWQSLVKLKDYHKPGITYLDYFWEQTKEKFSYGKN